MSRCFNCGSRITFQSQSDNGNWECQDCGQELPENNWYKKEYVCTGCDSFYTITTKSNELLDQNCLECKRMLVLISSNEVTNGA